MGYVAAIGAVASLVGSGINAYSQSQAGRQAAGGNTPVNLSQVSLNNPNFGLGQYAQQDVDIPGVARTAGAADTISNQQYQAMLTGLDPDLLTQIRQIGSTASSYLGGQIPQDVQDQIQRLTAQQSMQGGYAGTQMARNLTARDFGLTSIDLTNQGVTMAGTAANMAKGLNPSFTPVSSLLFSPAQLLARTDQANYYNNDIKNQQEILNKRAQVAAALAQAGGTLGAGRAASSGISSLFGGSSGSGGLLSGIMKMFSQSGSGGGGGGGFDFSGMTGGGGATAGDFTGGTSDFSANFGNAIGV